MILRLFAWSAVLSVVAGSSSTGENPHDISGGGASPNGSCALDQDEYGAGVVRLCGMVSNRRTVIPSFGD
jgi:hypothetical protein